MPTVLSVTLAVGASQLAKHKAIVTRITAIEELAGVTILCSDKTGTLTTNKLTIDKELLKTYSSSFNADDVILFAAYASRTENQDAIDGCVVNTLGNTAKAREGIQILDFKPFNPVDKRTEVTYLETETGKVKRATKGMASTIMNLCTRNKTSEQEADLERDVNEFASRGLRALAVACEEVPSNEKEGEGNGFELIGLLAIFDPPRDDTKQTLEDAQALGVQVKMATGDQLEIAKETGRRLGLGDNMCFPEHKFEIVKRLQSLGHLTAMTGDGANDAPALSRANVGVAVEGATDAARGAADIVLTEPGLSTIVEAIRGSRIIFQRMRNYSIYACAVTIRVVVCFAIMAFAWKFDFPPFMILIVALLNDGTIMTLSMDRVLPSDEPDSWDLFEIFTFAIGYGLYLTCSTLVLFGLTVHTNFFERKFGVKGYHEDINAPELHMIVYLHTSITSQALIFITRSKGWFFMEPPSLALFLAFCVAQAISSVVAAFASWSFTSVKPISGGWIGIIWVWSLMWLFPLDLVKFGIRKLVKSVRKSQARRRNRHAENEAELNRRVSKHESLYASRTSFINRAQRKMGFGKRGKRLHINEGEVARVSTIQTQQASRRLSRVGH
ncbi:hypothetical protein L7F22_003051 [Adiantum nelumboides]|nr:hypothetical protein [Adiantum nelumboides]